MLTEKDYDTLDAMEQYGGSFVKALANLARHADSNNIVLVKTTWWEYWSKYEKMAQSNKNQPQRPPVDLGENAECETCEKRYCTCPERQSDGSWHKK